MTTRRPLVQIAGDFSELPTADAILASCVDDLAPLIPSGRVYAGPLQGVAQMSPISGTAYWNYIGFAPRAITIDAPELFVVVVGVGAQTAELCIATTPVGPNRAGQTLTKIAATGSIDSLTATGLKRPSSALGAAVPARSHVWVGFREAMATTQARASAVYGDFGEGFLLATAAAGALTASSTFTGSLVTAGGTDGISTHPYLRLSLDF